MEGRGNAPVVMDVYIRNSLAIIISLFVLSGCSTKEEPITIFKMMAALEENGVGLLLKEKTELSNGDSYKYLIDGEKSELTLYLFDSEKERVKGIEDNPWIQSNEGISYNNMYLTYDPYGEVEQKTLPEKLDRTVKELSKVDWIRWADLGRDSY